jgi:hypothetical protein
MLPKYSIPMTEAWIFLFMVSGVGVMVKNPERRKASRENSKLRGYAPWGASRAGWKATA